MKHLLVLCLLLLSMCSIAQPTNKLPKKIYFVNCQTKQDDLFLVANIPDLSEYEIKSYGINNYLLGYVSRFGEVVIDLKYRYAEPFKDGYARVGVGDDKNRKLGIINRKGREVVYPKWDGCRYRKQGRFSVQEDLGVEQKHGFVDSVGQIVVPVKYSMVGDFVDSMAFVAIGKYDEYVASSMAANDNNPNNIGDFHGKYGFINYNGEEVIPLIYDNAGTFNNGYAKVGINGNYYMRYGFIDKSGKRVVECKYFDAGVMSSGRAYVARIIGGKPTYGYVDVNGEEVVPLKYRTAEPYNGNYALVSAFSDDGVCPFYYIDKLGNSVLPYPLYDVNNSGKYGHIAAAIKDADGYLRYGLLDKYFRVVIPFEFDSITLFSEWDSENNCWIEAGFVEKDGVSHSFTVYKANTSK